MLLQQGAKDDAEWQRARQKLYAEPPKVRKERRRTAAAGGPAAAHKPGGMTLDAVQAMLAGMAAEDASYG